MTGSSLDESLSQTLPAPVIATMAGYRWLAEFALDHAGFVLQSDPVAADRLRDLARRYLATIEQSLTPTGPEPAAVSATTQQLIDLLAQRDQAGRAKYGTSLDRTDLSHVEWLRHMAEELLDGAGYALAAIRTAAGQPALGAGWMTPAIEPTRYHAADDAGSVTGMALYFGEWPADGGPSIRQGRYDTSIGFVDSTTGAAVVPLSWSRPGVL